MQTLREYLQQIRKYLSAENPPEREENYVDLDSICFDKQIPEIHLLGYPEYNPVLPVFEIILEQIAKHRVDRIQVGLNELLKFYLVNLENQQLVPFQEILYRVELIFERCLQSDFPYTDKLWDFINRSLQNFAMYLMHMGKYEAAKASLDTLAQLGKRAAQEGLPTAVTQSALRMVEIKARQLNQESIAAQAKNYRFNLEI